MVRKRPVSTQVYWDSIDYDSYTIYIRIVIESRSGMRVSFGKEYISIRLSDLHSTDEIKDHIERSKHWALSQIRKNPTLINKYRSRDYSANPTLQILGESLTILTSSSDRKTGKATIENDTIVVQVPQHLDGHERSKMVKTLLSRIIGKSYLAKVKKRIDDINHRFFQKEIKNIYLKYNVSNWGSCSNKNNINLSTRLLLAPLWVVDYVIVHELAHLIEMNHSPNFWQIVEEVYPNYQEAEQWLKHEGNSCFF